MFIVSFRMIIRCYRSKRFTHNLLLKKATHLGRLAVAFFMSKLMLCITVYCNNNANDCNHYTDNVNYYF